jgi:predicted small secreted protein
MKKGIMFNMIALSVVLFATINAGAQDTTTAGQDIKVAAKKTGRLRQKVLKR